MKNNKNVKKEILFIKYLQEEEKHCIKVCDDAKIEMESIIRKAHHDFNVFDKDIDHCNSPDQSTDDSDECEDIVDVKEKKSNHPAWAKKIYRKIATETHPDKMHKDLDEDKKKDLLEKYQESKKLLDKSQYIDIFIMADDLSIDLSDIKIQEDDIFSEIEKRKTSLMKSIDSLMKSYFWVWAHASDEERERIVKDVIAQRGWTSRESSRRKSRKGAGTHPGKSISQIKKSNFFKK